MIGVLLWAGVGLLLLWLPAVSSFSADCSIAIDVGHFLERPGTTSARGVTEFQFNVDLARVIERATKKNGCRATLIGEHGDIADLRERTARARGAKFFLSVHHDSTAERFLDHWVIDGVDRLYSDRFSGFALFISHENPQPENSLRCASAIGAALSSSGFAPSLFHADPMFGEPRRFADERNGVHWFDGLVVLKTATQPAVLLEAGVLVNRNEELLLQRPDIREHIAAAAADAMVDCLSDRP